MEFDMPATLLRITIAKDFSDTPGPRSKDEGEFSGEAFLEKLLLPLYEQARSEKGTLLIDLDGAEGYATSFLEAAFGELARRYDPQEVLSILTFKSDDEPYLIDEVKKYISEARR
jgi:hypothetical protein